MSLRLLLLSTPVGPLGSGLGGGVEFTVTNLARVAAERGHQVTVAAPLGSSLPDSRRHPNVSLIQIRGAWQITAQRQSRTAPVITSAVLANLWDYARQHQADYDLLINFAYDWLPFYLTPFLSTPVAHFVSMGSLSEAMDEAIALLAHRNPHTLGVYTRSQARTFKRIASEAWATLGCGVDLSQYPYSEASDGFLAWVGRISPEKGLEDAIAASARTRRKLKVFGKLEDPIYWNSIQRQIERTAAEVEYCGFLSSADLPRRLSGAMALVMTPKWIEAFGIVAIEALACGVPVVAYARGGPAEIVRNGETGWLVEPDSVTGLCKAVARLPDIDRRRCREQAEAEYGLAAWGDRCERWFYQLLSSTISD